MNGIFCVTLSLTETFGFDLKNAINLCTFFSGVLQYTYILSVGINIKSNALSSEILLKEQ